MEYYGNIEEKRLDLVVRRPIKENNSTAEAKSLYDYIAKTGNIMDYVFDQSEKLGDNSGYYSTLANRDYEAIDYKGKRFYKVRSRRKNYYFYYIELDRIYNGDGMYWKTNAKYEAKECTVVDGVFEFQCVALPNGNAHIDVKYNKCDNFHRNKVTIAEINVYEASNHSIRQAIRKWKEEFKQEIKEA